MVLQRRRRTRREIPEQPDEHRDLYRAMTREATQICERMHRRIMLDAQIVEHDAWSQEREAGHDKGRKRADAEECDAGIARRHAREPVAEHAAEQVSRNDRQRCEDIPHRTDLAAHRVLLRERCGKTALRARHEQEGRREQY